MNLITRCSERLVNFGASCSNQVARLWSGQQLPSIYFFTFHKAASTLFSEFVLKTVPHRKHIDYGRLIYRNQITSQDVRFEPLGHVYGPIRIIPRCDALDYQWLVGPTTDREFLTNKKVICLVRDPRDILVSEYHSFGTSHGYSRNPQIQLAQRAIREKIRSQSIDEFVVNNAIATKLRFQKMDEVRNWAQESTVLKFETLVHDFDAFAGALRRQLDLSHFVIRQIYRRTRPSRVERPHSHRRSGRTGTFRERLAPGTLAQINEILAVSLDSFGYPLD